jgi:hypothetical protein
MTQPGIGALLHYMSGGSEQDPAKYYGRKITEVAMIDEQLRLTFEDDTLIKIYDNGQSCCESRYMTTDDDVQSLVGHKLVGITSKPGEDIDNGEVHETCFIEVATDGGFITLTNHNEHNGYYGGFGLTVVEV